MILVELHKCTLLQQLRIVIIAFVSIATAEVALDSQPEHLVELS